MGRKLVGSLGIGVVAVLGVSGCGSSQSPPAESSAAPSASGSASASSTGTPSTGTPSSGTSKEAVARATSATRKALLPAAAFTKIGLEVAEKPKTDKWDWFNTCQPYLPSESRQVIGTAGAWKGDGGFVSQAVVAYPDGVAEDLVDEVTKAVSCRSYTADGRSFSKVKALDLPKVESADATTAWCMVEEAEDETVCHSVIAAQDLVSSLWVRSGDSDGAKDATAALTVLAAERIRAQVS